VLLSPGPFLMANSAQSLLVSWQKAPSVGPVNVYLEAGSDSGYVLAASNVTNDFVAITLPAAASNRASVRIQDPSNANSSDSVDGFFSIRGSSGLFTTPPASATLVIGSESNLSWVSPQGSALVDLDLWNPATGAFQNIVTSLADFGMYSWLVPAAPGANAFLRATFRNATGAAIGTAQSPNFNIGVGTVPSISIDAPAPGALVSGVATISGWAIDNTATVGSAIGAAQVRVDGAAVGTATYGITREDVCAAYPGRAGCPNVGFTYALDTTSLAAGSHIITVSAFNTETPNSTGSANVAFVIVAATTSGGKCDIDGSGVVNVGDIQQEIDEALGAAPAVNDLNGDGVVNVVDVQIVFNGALGLGCTAK
jgi:hypothetical protein